MLEPTCPCCISSVVIALCLRLCLVPGKEGQSHCSFEGFMYTVFKQGLGMPFIGKNLG